MATRTLLQFATNVTQLPSSSSSISTGCPLSPFFLKACDSPRARVRRRSAVCCSFASMESAKIKVVGVGGGGNNAVNRMIGSGLQVSLETDNSSLRFILYVFRIEKSNIIISIVQKCVMYRFKLHLILSFKRFVFRSLKKKQLSFVHNPGYVRDDFLNKI